MTYTYPPPVPMSIGVAEFLLHLLMEAFALAAALGLVPTDSRMQPNRMRRRRLTVAALVVISGAVAIATPDVRACLRGYFTFWEILAASLAVARLASRLFRFRFSPLSAGAGIFLGVCLVFATVMLPAVKLARESSRRSQHQHQLKHVGVAIYNYADANAGVLPKLASDPSDGPIESWRVALLPILDQAPLQKSYSASHEWDAPANLPAARTKLNEFTCEKNDYQTDEFGRCFTAVAAVSGPRTAFPEKKGISINAITDGTSQTILLGECSGLNIVWTEPRDIDTSKQKIGINLPGDRPRTSSSILSSYHPGGAYVVFADGRVEFLSEKIDPKVLEALTTATGGEDLPSGSQ